MIRAAMVLVVLGILAPGRAQDACGPGNPSCYVPHETPGCLQPRCCDLVCEFDLFCCIDVWDDFCVEQAEILCTEVYCPEEGECLEVHDGPGCIDDSCCEFVRLHDPFCGFGSWDRLCVAEAERWCGGGGTDCVIDPPPGSMPEGEPCLERLNDGCGNAVGEILTQAIGCGATIHGKTTTSVPRDVDWYRLDDPGSGRLTVTLRSEFPGRLLLVSGRCEGPIRTESIHAVDACGESTFDVVPPQEDDWYLVVEAGVGERIVRSGLPCDEIDPKDPPEPDEEPLPREYGLHYLLTISCGPACVGDLDGDGTVGGSDLGLLFIDWGPCDGCGADLDGDGTVGGSDLGLLFVAWGGC